MGKKPKTEAEKQRARAEGTARAFNEREAAKAPLLAWGGLTTTRTADEVLERRAAFQEQAFWDGLAMAERDAQTEAVMAWRRFIVWSLVDSDTYASVCRWADSQTIQTFIVGSNVYQALADDALIFRSYKWRQAADRVQRGEPPITESGRIYPKACWLDLQREISSGVRPCHLGSGRAGDLGSADRWRAVVDRHSNCSPDFCRVSLRPRRCGRLVGSWE